MAKGHRTQIKRARNNEKDTRPRAVLSYARVPVQKACFVLDAIRGKDVATAEAILTYNPRYASKLVLKLLQSACANAENNNGMNKSDLYVAECYAGQGPVMKRIRPRAQGRAYRILHRTSTITLILDEK
ncbi:MAG: 50S ribosomal protein L22 [Lachnospiraceae bacterium]|nr:50S ribosomal protein L22 [Lachnospiraceae bacterium]